MRSLTGPGPVWSGSGCVGGPLSSVCDGSVSLRL